MMRKWCLVAMAAMLLGGCGKKTAGGGETPDATFTQFDAAMRAGKFDEAAALIDFDVLAKQANPDWDSIPPGQQREITTKMREDAAGRLAGMGYPADGMPGEPNLVQAGDKATVKATGGGQSLTLGMAKAADGWRIVSGLPTMTTD